MIAQEVLKHITLEGSWTRREREEFDAELKKALKQFQREFGLDGFCVDGGSVESVDFYQIEFKTFDPEKVIGVIHVAFIECIHPEDSKVTIEKHHHVRYGFELDRNKGLLRLGRGFLRG